MRATASRRGGYSAPTEARPDGRCGSRRLGQRLLPAAELRKARPSPALGWLTAERSPSPECCSLQVGHAQSAYVLRGRGDPSTRATGARPPAADRRARRKIETRHFLVISPVQHGALPGADELPARVGEQDDDDDDDAGEREQEQAGVSQRTGDCSGGTRSASHEPSCLLSTVGVGRGPGERGLGEAGARRRRARGGQPPAPRSSAAWAFSFTFSSQTQ